MIVDGIRQGNHMSVVARSVGLKPETVYDWISQGEQQTGGTFDMLYLRTKQAEAEAESVVVSTLLDQASVSWQAGIAYLERRFPERWSKRERTQLEITGKDGSPIDVRGVQMILDSDDMRGMAADMLDQISMSKLVELQEAVNEGDNDDTIETTTDEREDTSIES